MSSLRPSWPTAFGRMPPVEAKRRHFGHAELLGGLQPAVTGNDIPVAIDQDRNDEAEDLDTVTDLPDLLLRMPPRVGGSGFSASMRR